MPGRRAAEHASMTRFGSKDLDESATADGLVMTRALGWLFVAGATIGLASLLLPHAPQTNLGALAVNIAAAYVGGVTILVFSRRMPYWMLQLAMFAGTLLITRAIYFSGRGISFYSVWYVWVSLYSFHFFSRRQAMAHTFICGIAYAAVLTDKHEPQAGARWLTTIGTVLIVGAFTDALVRRVRRERAGRMALMEQLERLAHTDELTGLPNRRALHEALTREMARSVRDHQPLSVAMIDVDDFKALNDEHGHLFGDQVLKRLSSAWSAVVRRADLLARYGGDEFVAVLRACGPAEVQVVAERLIRATPGEHSISVGTATWDGVQDLDALLSDADVQLYIAKRSPNRLAAVAP
jgi:diguanylate cyclase (GGDEF)-like protein